MPLLLLTVFISVSVIQLFACYTDRLMLKAYSKGYILTSLIAIYLFNAQNLSKFFLFALVLCMLGDVLLLSRNTFVMGGVAFFLAHVCFIHGYIDYVNLRTIPVVFIILFTAVMFGSLMSVIFHVSRDRGGPIIVAACGYLISVLVHSEFAAGMLFTNPGAPTTMIFTGSLLFFFSDCLLVIRNFKSETKIKKISFLIMLTYILALILITAGYMMLTHK